MKHRIVHTLQKYFLNPPIKLALAMSLPLPGYALLETKGRKTGKPRRTPVGDGRIGNEFWLVAEPRCRRLASDTVAHHCFRGGACSDQRVKSHPPTEPLRNDRVCHYVRAKLLRCQALPSLLGCGTPFRCFQSATFNTAVFDSVVHYGRAIAGINEKPVACQHRAPSALTRCNPYAKGLLSLRR
jgi:hypothetical protein